MMADGDPTFERLLSLLDQVNTRVRAGVPAASATVRSTLPCLCRCYAALVFLFVKRQHPELPCMTLRSFDVFREIVMRRDLAAASRLAEAGASVGVENGPLTQLEDAGRLLDIVCYALEFSPVEVSAVALAIHLFGEKLKASASPQLVVDIASDVVDCLASVSRN